MLTTRPQAAVATEPEIESVVEAGPVARLGGLVLSRRVDQSIMIGDDVAVEVVELRPGAVRLRVVAPRSIAVHRREVYDAIQAAPRPEPAARPSSGGGGGGLVLTRHVGQSITIGDSVEVIVAEIKAGAARLRVVAPREVTVHRLEIYDAIRA